MAPARTKRMAESQATSPSVKGPEKGRTPEIKVRKLCVYLMVLAGAFINTREAGYSQARVRSCFDPP